MKIKIFNREIGVCALLATNLLSILYALAILWLCVTKQRRNGVKYGTNFIKDRRTAERSTEYKAAYAG